MYYKGKWCTAGGKDPLFGHVDGFQIDPKNSLGKASLVADRIQILPSIAENGYGHGYFRDDLVQNPRPGANNYIINDPQRRIDKHPYKADLLRAVRIPADRGRNIRGHRQAESTTNRPR